MSGSNSNSSQAQSQEQQDNRIAAAENSVNVVMSRSDVRGPVNITSTDHAAVEKSFEFALAMAEGAASANAASIEAISSSTQNSLEAVQDAYSTAKSGEQKVMVAGALALLGIVAIKVLHKG